MARVSDGSLRQRTRRIFKWFEALVPTLAKTVRSRYGWCRHIYVHKWQQWLAWRRRIRTVLACPDNQQIPRVRNAGRIVDGRLVMHNGLRIVPGSYYGGPMLRLLRKNRGVHEPQEEHVFAEALKRIPPGGVIVELGAYWGFYSLWFCQVVPGAVAHLIEPNASNLRSGEENFAVNGYRARFHQAYVGAATCRAPDGIAALAVDGFVAQERIGRIDILHSDIQGAEADMLRGATRALAQNRIRFVFISTHSNPLHEACEKFLRERCYQIVVSVNLEQTYSHDGVLVAQAPGEKGLEHIRVSKRTGPR
jgi:hypothetical protein